MESYQQRVVDEKADLDGKLERLTAFIGSDKFASVPEPEQWRMRTQKWAMICYSEVLGSRIAAFG
jgi:hypothetical protein